MRADLHIHSTYSDGSLSPGKITSLAAERGLSVIAITDHDTMTHFAESKSEAGKNGITMIPGIEFSTVFNGRELHILGYAVDERNPELAVYLDKARKRRIKRAHEILERLAGNNIRIPPEELIIDSKETSVGRMLIARYLLSYGYVHSINEAFDRYLGSSGSAFVPYELPDALDVVAMISEWCGVSVFAHPSRHEFDKYAPALCEAGLQGAEVYRPGLTGHQSRMIEREAKALGLVLTGGSDWHYEGGRLNLGDFYVETGRIARFLELVCAPFETGP